jgi:hypothetical protein
MEPMGLPPAAAFPLIVGMLTNIYGAIAVMGTLPFDTHTLTLMAIFLLIAHNLIQEGAVQHASGIHGLVITAIRLVAATLTVMVVSIWLPPQPLASPHAAAYEILPFAEAFYAWGLSTLALCMKILGILLVLMPCIEISKILGLAALLARISGPVLLPLGLPRSTALLWLTAVLFGLSYGAAVIVEEARTGTIPKDDLENLHVSIAINHSMVEDPALFLPLGLPALWLWLPRILTALIFVRIWQLWQHFRPVKTPILPHP